MKRQNMKSRLIAGVLTLVFLASACLLFGCQENAKTNCPYNSAQGCMSKQANGTCPADCEKPCCVQN